MKTQAEINQAIERMLAAEKLISKAIGQNISLRVEDLLTEEQAIEFEKMLGQYERDLEVYGELIDEMEAEQKKKSAKSTSTTKVNSAAITLMQLDVTFKIFIITVKSFISTIIAKVIAVKNFVSIVSKKATKAKNLIKTAVTELISLIKS